MERFSNICLPKVCEECFNHLNVSGPAQNAIVYATNLFAEPSLNILTAISGGCPPRHIIVEYAFAICFLYIGICVPVQIM